MSTTINQIIEVRRNGQWEYVPLADTVTDRNDCLVKYGSIRDIFAYHWYSTEKMVTDGIPEDISKRSREAMVYQTEDYVECGSCWVGWSTLEAISEMLREKMMSKVDELVSCGKQSAILDRISRLESRIDRLTGTDSEKDIEDRTEEDAEYCSDNIRSDMEDLMWTWVAVERNMAEIEAYVDRYTDGDYKTSDIRVIMYVG